MTPPKCELCNFKFHKSLQGIKNSNFCMKMFNFAGHCISERNWFFDKMKEIRQLADGKKVRF